MAAENLAHQQPDPDSTAQPGGSMTPGHLLACAMAFWRSALLLAAHDLGLFATLVSGPQDSAGLEQRLGLRMGVTSDLLAGLVGLGLVVQSGDLYRNTPEASLFLDPAQPQYIGRWLTMASAAMREMADLTFRLRAPAGGCAGAQPPLAGSIWSEIESFLRAPGLGDGA